LINETNSAPFKHNYIKEKEYIIKIMIKEKYLKDISENKIN